MESQIYNFSEPAEYLSAVFEEKRTKNPRYSMRSWAKQLGLSNPTMLLRILKKERALSSEMGAKLANKLDLKKEERLYFELLILKGRAKSAHEKEIFSDLIQKVAPKSSVYNLSVEHFRIISEWHHFAILEMVELADFDASPQWLSDRLKNQISSTEAQHALDRLLRLGIIEKNKSGKIQRAKDFQLFVEPESKNLAIQKFHKTMMGKALVSLENENIEERDIRGTTLSLNEEQYLKVIEVMKKAHKEVLNISSASAKNKEQTYQINSQIFRLTQKSKSERKSV